MDDKEPGNGQDWVEDARAELSGMMKQRMDHPSTKPVLTGAAVGVVGAALLPVITWPVGLAAGAGYMLYRRIKR
ncbi:hypothetical protein [Alteriqipengyuania lutimaris]|uniref:hypothetical protein n=1 Tax=Alteriqipengyuania lutimaris TaxID=1538146 RepID=UPI001CFCEC16|nr:hypothetical protein [Alteriqipengyuania lutimaris]